MFETWYCTSSGVADARNGQTERYDSDFSEEHPGR